MELDPVSIETLLDLVRDLKTLGFFLAVLQGMLLIAFMVYRK